MMRRLRPLSYVLLLLVSVPLLFLSGCQRPEPEVTISATLAALVPPPTPFLTPQSGQAPPTPEIQPPAMPGLPTYDGTLTPDPTRPVAAGEENYLTHTIGPGETLAYIAQRYGSSVEELMRINNLAGADLLLAGQSVLVPGSVSVTSPDFKIIPDSELVYGPAARDFSVRSFAEHYNGYLVQHQEEVEGQLLAGPEIVSLIAHRF